MGDKGRQGAELEDDWRKLCGENTYATTLHQLNAGLIKLARVTKKVDQMLYRGVAGGVLPECFWHTDENGICGGVDYSICSFSSNKKQALDYAKANTSTVPEKQLAVRSLVLQMYQGMADRGADICWLSQYPEEA